MNVFVSFRIQSIFFGVFFFFCQHSSVRFKSSHNLQVLPTNVDCVPVMWHQCKQIKRKNDTQPSWICSFFSHLVSISNLNLKPKTCRCCTHTRPQTLPKYITFENSFASDTFCFESVIAASVRSFLFIYLFFFFCCNILFSIWLLSPPFLSFILHFICRILDTRFSRVTYLLSIC